VNHSKKKNTFAVFNQINFCFMIDFNNIGKHSYPWDVIMPFFRLAFVDLFFKERCVIGRENIPPPGTPIFIIANHQNSFNDALLLVSMFKDYRQPVSLARGDIFKKNFLAKIFRFWRVMPAFRTRDASSMSDIKENLITFQIASKILVEGGVIIMFPEALHQQGRWLTTFKKGVPRVCFEAEAAANYNLKLQILPVNLHYSDIHKFREKVLIEIGKPFEISELFETYKNSPNDAYLKFNEKARPIIKSMIVNIENDEYYKPCNLLREVVRLHNIRNNYKKYNYYDEFKEEKKAVAQMDTLRENEPEKFESLMKETKEYSDLLDTLNFKDWLVNKKTTRFGLIARSFLWVLLSPFFLFSFINNAIPWYVANWATGKIKDKIFVGSVRFVISFFGLPTYYAIVCVIASLLTKSFLVGFSYTVLAFLSLFVYHHYRRFSIKLWHSWRYFQKKKTNEIKQLGSLKNSILLFFK